MSFSFELTDEHAALREKGFARDVMRPVATRYDAAQEFPWPVLEEAARQGFYGWELNAQLSIDPTGLSLPILMEELFWGCAGIVCQSSCPRSRWRRSGRPPPTSSSCALAPECFGSPGDIKLAALAVTEPSGGSDIRSIQTRARADGDDWVLDGQKVFIGNGGIADVHIVVATVDPEAGHGGQAVFIVPKGTAGLTLLRKLDKLGCRAPHTDEIVLENCRIPAEHLLGGNERLQERSAKAASPSRDASRSPPPRKAAPRRRCIAAARRGWPPSAIHLRTQRDRCRSSKPPRWRSAPASRRSRRWMGGWGYIKDFPVEKWYCDAKLYAIFEGTSEIQRLVIGRALRAQASIEPLDQRMQNPS